MHRITAKDKLEIGAYVVTLSLAVLCVVVAFEIESEFFTNFLIGVAGSLSSAAVLFFLLNRFFGLETDTVDHRFDRLLQAIEGKYRILKTDQDIDDFFPFRECIETGWHLDIMSYELRGLLDGHWAQMLDRVKRGGRIRLLMIDPFSEAQSILAVNSKPHRPYERDIVLSLLRVQYMLQCVNDVKSKIKGSLEIRLMNWIPSTGLFVVNSRSKDGIVWVTFHSPHYATPRADSNMNIVFERRQEEHWFTYFATQFDRLWEDASEWNGNVPEFPIPTVENLPD